MRVLHRFGGMQVNGENAMRDLDMLHFKGDVKDKMAGYIQDCESQKLKKYKGTDFLLIKFGLVF